MRSPGGISALVEGAQELFRALRCGGVLVTMFRGEDHVLLIFVDRSRAYDTNLQDKYVLWLNKEVIEIKFGVVINDAFSHPLCQRLRQQTGFGVGAYLGAPIKDKDGRTVGSVGAFHKISHRWSDTEIECVQQLACDALNEA